VVFLVTVGFLQISTRRCYDSY